MNALIKTIEKKSPLWFCFSGHRRVSHSYLASRQRVDSAQENLVLKSPLCSLPLLSPASEKCWYKYSPCQALSSGNQPHAYRLHTQAATSSGLALGPFSHHCVTAGPVTNSFGCYFCKEAADASGPLCQSTQAGNLASGDTGGSCRHARPGREAIAIKVSVQKGNKKDGMPWRHVVKLKQPAGG